MENNILTVKEAAEILRISKSKCYQLARNREIPPVILGGRIVIPERQLREWIDASVCGGDLS